MIKMVAVDMDGTLLNSQHQIDPKTTAALKELVAKGIKVVPASGRPLTGVMPYLNKLALSGEDNYAILYNGGLVQNLAGKTILNNEMHYADFKNLLAIQKLGKSNLHFVRQKYYYTLDHDFSLIMAKISYLSGMPFRIREFDQIKPDFSFLKCEFTGPKRIIDQLGEKFPSSFYQQYNVTRSDPRIWEVNSKNASKGNAIHHLASYLGIKDSEVMIFGDQGNDRSMFENSDFKKVAMGNAITEIKEKANFVTKSNDEAGIAYAIHQLILKE